MARRFINDRLVTVKRFAPGQHETAPAEPGNAPTAAVSAHTPSVPVAPAPPAPPPSPTVAPAPPAPVPETAASPDLHHVLRREDEELRSGLREKELDEFRRRQREVRDQLTRAIHTLENEQSLAQARLDLLHRLEEELASLQTDRTKPLTGDEFRAAKRAVDQAYLELLKLEREELEETSSHDHARVEIASLTLGQLTRLGLGLTWPLILGLLIAATMVAVALLSVFGRG